jgi:hypothetical protein
MQRLLTIAGDEVGALFCHEAVKPQHLAVCDL